MHIALMASLPLASGCGMAREGSALARDFWRKLDELARVDYHNEALRAENAALRAENARLKRKLAGSGEEHRADRIHEMARSEGGDPRARIIRGLVPEMSESHGGHGSATVSHGEHATPTPGERHPSSAPAHEEHASPAPHSSHDATPASHHEVKAEHHDGGHGQGRKPASVAPQEESFTLLSAPPRKVFQEAMKAFDHGEYDRAARGFVALATNQDNQTFATPQVRFLAGVSLYHLKNYGGALKFFDQVLSSSHDTKSIVLSPKALLWKALAQRKLGQASEAKATAQRLLEQYPDSPEARKIN